MRRASRPIGNCMLDEIAGRTAFWLNGGDA
jgi:hypothetical protein